MNNNKIIKKEQWFERITGLSEEKFRKYKNKIILCNGDEILIRNIKTNEIFSGGSFKTYYLLSLKNSLPKINKYNYPPIELIKPRDANKRYVDVSYLQSLYQNRNAVFQIASNFNCVECVSENSRPSEKKLYNKLY